MSILLRRCGSHSHLKILLFLFSNLCTALIVYLGVYLSLQHSTLVEIQDYSNNVGRQMLEADDDPYKIVPRDRAPPAPCPPASPLRPTTAYYLFNKSRTDPLPVRNTSEYEYGDLCKLDSISTSQTLDKLGSSASKLSKAIGWEKQAEFLPYVIGITPTYYRLTQKADLTSLCQTLMNVPRLLWVVIEDSENTSQQVRDILSRCQVESVLLSMATTNDSKVAKQKGVDQRNYAMDWIRGRCRECEGRGTCEGVVYFMDDDNTYDIRLFDKIRWTKGVSVFPVGLVAGLRFEGPICKNGKVDNWQVAYSPKRHIPVDMAAFALNVRTIVSHPNVRMGFKPGSQTKRSTPGYLEPDFLKSLGAKRETVECRGVDDEILVWHVKTSYKSLIYEKKYPSNPDMKV